MTDGAREYFDMLTREYAKAGYPHPKTWAFSPDDGEERIYNELKAHGLIKQFTVAMCVLTEQGLSRILARLPATPEANALFEDLKRQYIAAGYPPRRTWAFAPNDDENESTYSELRARGYIEQLTVVMYILSNAGHSEIMQSNGGH